MINTLHLPEVIIVSQMRDPTTSPLSVCWDITSRCNDDCAFCYRVLGKPDLNITQHRVILSKIIRAGVRKVSFVGGEPLLVPHLPILLNETREAGVITAIDTNGILLERKWNSIANSVDWITLPIDGSNEQIQSQMTRRQGHLDLVLSLIRSLSNYHIKLKINTLVGRPNIADLPNIAKLVGTLGVARWKVFQFLPVRGHAVRNASEFSISDQQFACAVHDALPYLGNHSGCDVTIADRDYLQRNYFLISSDGNVRVTVNEGNIRDIIIGSLLKQDVEEIWQSPLFDHEKHMRFRAWLR
jgi:MoaA/NifB/PqqE/SkfB family radical SAM enzyme